VCARSQHHETVQRLDESNVGRRGHFTERIAADVGVNPFLLQEGGGPRGVGEAQRDLVR